MNFAEIIAAKKAAALAASAPSAPITDAPVPAPVLNVVAETPEPEQVAETPTKVFTDAMVGIHAKPEAEQVPVEKPEPPMVVNKVLTFSEKMALKNASAKIVAEATAQPTLPAAFQKKLQDKIVAVLADAAEQEDMQREEYAAATEETRKSYKDIRGLVNALSDTDDTDLAIAMSDLRKSLIQNPSACMLMLDEEIGAMTIALRRLTQEALVANTKEPKEKKAKVSKILTAEEMQRVLDEI